MSVLTANLKRCVLLAVEGVISPHTKGFDENSAEEPRFLPGANEGLRVLAEHGFQVFAMTDTPLLATKQGVWERPTHFARKWLLEIALEGGHVERVYLRPSEAADGLDCSGNTTALVGRILKEQKLSFLNTYFITDNIADLEAAAVAGCTGILVRRGHFLDVGLPSPFGPEIVSNLIEAAERIVTRSASPLSRELHPSAPRLIRQQ